MMIEMGAKASTENLVNFQLFLLSFAKFLFCQFIVGVCAYAFVFFSS